MAIYKNREVLLTSNIALNNPEPKMVSISYPNGSTESVKLSEVRFTKEEKKNILDGQSKETPDLLNEISDEDLKKLQYKPDLSDLEIQRLKNLQQPGILPSTSDVVTNPALNPQSPYSDTVKKQNTSVEDKSVKKTDGYK